MSIGERILFAFVAAAIVAGVLMGVIARTVARLVCGQASMQGGFINGLTVVFLGNTSTITTPAGCAVPLTAIRVTVGVLAALLLIAAAIGFALWTRYTQSESYFIRDLRGRAGLAKRHEIRAFASGRAMLKRAKVIRPALTHPKPKDVAWKIARSGGHEVYVSAEDSIALEGPPRSGKGRRILIGAILDWSGPLITTSTRADNLTATMRQRARMGTVSVFDPQGITGVPGGLKVSPIDGCDDPLVADQRARAIIAGTAMGASSKNREWAEESAGILSRLLHAAAIGHMSVNELYLWGASPEAAQGAVQLLQSDGAAGWAEELQSVISGDPKLRASSWLGVKSAVRPLGIPQVRAAFSPTPTERFDPNQFLDGANTLYLVGTGTGAGAVGGFLGAVLDDVVETARRRAASSPGARLAMPLGLALDEIVNMFAWPQLPTLMADGGGIGISPLVVLQALTQAEHAWSRAEADTIWSAATAKILLGGASHVQHLRDIEALLGTRKVHKRSTSYSQTGDTNSIHKELVPVVTLDELRRMPETIGLLTYKNRRGVLLDLPSWTDRSDAKRLSRDRTEVERTQRETFDGVGGGR